VIIGPYVTDNSEIDFRVWAPFRNRVDVHLIASENMIIPMEKDAGGYWCARVPAAENDFQYFLRLEGKTERPDPASPSQPEGVHGPSRVIDHRQFKWADMKWKGIPLAEFVIYELHVGTFTMAGTFEAIIDHLPHLKELGVNAIELMPVAQFPGQRNWGYDGAYPFAPQNSYGGPTGLKTLINACHNSGFAVILDVVYNHLGPEGNYLRDFGPYFTTRYRTPWGEAINFDGAYSDEIRNFFCENALYWFHDFHIDALRLDAIHAIYDMSAKPFLQELAEKVAEFSRLQRREYYLIAESNLNDSRIVVSPRKGGYGLHAQWLDDYHHSLRTLLTGEKRGYYVDFGTVGHFRKSLQDGFVYSGQYSEFRKRSHGNSSRKLDASRFVAFTQNHDQVGNRMGGERLSELVSFAALKLAAAACLLSPYIPLIFMGEEYAEEAPFLYFVHHGDPQLVEAVRRGRREEFREFKWEGDPPDPQDIQTFQKSRLNRSLKDKIPNKILLGFYQMLIHLRKTVPALHYLSNKQLKISKGETEKTLLIQRWHEINNVLLIMHLDENPATLTLDLPPGRWQKMLDSAEPEWNGPGSDFPKDPETGQLLNVTSWQVVLYEREK
jgi:maltooligosyltrehalose trehalohydrolase